jgi:tRNA A-37 threonylcarbamoyl transferase component Bud32
MAFVGGTCVDRNRKRSVSRVEWNGQGFYLKRFTHPPAKDALFQIFCARLPRTHAAREWEMAGALGAAGIVSPDIAAYGEASGMGLKRPSFLLTVELNGYVPLLRYREEKGDRFGRRRSRDAFIGGLAGLVRRMHKAGITHPDLYSSHIFVREPGGEEDFALIDLHRVSQRGRISLFDAVRDLTGLHLTVPPSAASRADRVRFLRHYFGEGGWKPAGKRLAGKVLRRAARIGSRRRFREILGSS